MSDDQVKMGVACDKHRLQRV